MNTLTPKQEAFTRYIFEGLTQREAWIKAGYSNKYPVEIIDTNACNLAKSNKVKTRYEELQKAAEDKSVATVLERKQVATKGIRGELRDIEIIENPDGTKIKKVKTTSRAPFIAELNKMEHIYTEAPTVNIDNRKVEIYVGSDKAKQLVEKIVSGELLG